MQNKNQTSTLLDLLDNGDPSNLAVVVPGGPRVTYKSLKSQVVEFRSHLRTMGIGPDDRIAMVLPSGIESIIAFLAASTLGTAAPLNPMYKATEFDFFLKDTNATALITSGQIGEQAREVAAPSSLDIRINVNRDGKLKVDGSDLKADVFDTVDIKDDHVALVLHTSGTTSRPKRVPLLHSNLLASVKNIVNTYALSSNDVSLCVMPLFHVHGLVASTLATLYSGGTVVIPERFTPLKFWPMVESYGVTWFSAVPSMFQALIRRSKGKKISSDNSLRFIRSCSAALPIPTLRQMENIFKVPVVEAYGMTEAAHQMTSNLLPPEERIPGSVGGGIGVEVGIMDEEGLLKDAGATGEVVIKGPNVIRQYENNPEANTASFVNGWFRTGDQGMLSRSGTLTLQGRLKEMINRSGEKISPLEIDEVLLSHPAVLEAVAFGVSDDIHGEVPVGAVVLNYQITDSELIDYCRTKMASFKVPRTIYIVDSIPRTATGKVQRRIVAEVIVDGISK